ncbi:MAG: TonB-dependent receptor, partial [Bacteroidota bacterium]
RFSDPNIKWETTISKNLGIDLTMFNNRLNLTVDIYQNDKEDMLLQERLPPSSGTHHPNTFNIYDVRVTNAGNMVNKGIELSLSYNNTTAYGLKWNITTTFTRNKNEVTDLNGIERGYANGRPVLSLGGDPDFTTFLAVGYEAGAFFLVQNDGIIKTQEELDAYSLIDASAQLGDVRYIDQNGDNTIDENDRVYLGSGQADFETGLNLSFEYKGIDLFVQTYYSHGAEIYNGAKFFAYGWGRHLDQYHMWSPQNPDSDIATYRQSAFHNNVRARSDYFLEDGTYLRIRNLTLGYTLPKEFTLKYGIERFRIYATATNPFTFTAYDGYDPEVGGDGIFTRGLDRGNYPVTRHILGGIQISL